MVAERALFPLLSQRLDGVYYACTQSEVFHSTGHLDAAGNARFFAAWPQTGMATMHYNEIVVTP